MARLLDVDEAAEYLGAYTPSALRSMVKRRQIPHVKIGSRLLFDVRKLDRWIDANSEPAR